MVKKLIPGEGFELSAEVVEAHTRNTIETTRHHLALIGVGSGLGFLIGAAILGIVHGNFDALVSVWAVVGPVVGAIFGHYFGGEAGKDPPP